VLFADGTLCEDDREELQEAFITGKISPEQYDLACRTAQRLSQGWLSHVEMVRNWTRTQYDILAQGKTSQ